MYSYAHPSSLWVYDLRHLSVSLIVHFNISPRTSPKGHAVEKTLYICYVAWYAAIVSIVYKIFPVTILHVHVHIYDRPRILKLFPFPLAVHQVLCALIQLANKSCSQGKIMSIAHN